MENIYFVFRVLYFWLKVFGIFPMSFVGPLENGVLKIKWTDVLLSCLSFLTVCMLTCFNLLNLEIVVEYSAVLSTAWTTSLFFGFFAILIMFLHNILKCKTHEKFLRSCNEFDKTVCSMV